MYSTRQLTDEEYALLPCFARAFKCNCGEKFTGEFISITPGYIKFAHDQPSDHLVKVTLWNKTREFIQLEIDPPKTNVFIIYHDKRSKGLYSGTETSLFVKCVPHERKICFDCLRIKVNSGQETISVPLQLFPGLAWFAIPKLIVLPHVTVGNVAEVTVNLPQVPSAEKFFVLVKTPDIEAFSVTPFNGILKTKESDEGVKELVIRYSPKEYITLVYSVEVHFPGVDTFPHEIIFFARSIPGFESEGIMRERAEILSLKPKVSRKKVPEPRMKLVASCMEDFEPVPGDEPFEREEDLTKPAGVMHFLLRKGGTLHENTKTIGAMGMSTAEERRIYTQKEKEFHDALNRENIRQKHIPHQNHKSFYGDNPVDSTPGFVNKILRQREQQQSHYEKALGLTDDVEDLNRNKIVVSNQRSLRRLGEELTPKPNFDSSAIEGMEQESRELTRKAVLGRFVQAVYAVTTRYRASKRIVKLKIMKKEILEARKKGEKRNSEKGELAPGEMSPRQKILNGLDISGAGDRVERTSLVNNYLELRKSIKGVSPTPPPPPPTEDDFYVGETQASRKSTLQPRPQSPKSPVEEPIFH